MTKRHTVSKAEKLLAEATEKVIQDGGVVHEDALFDAAEAALDGKPKQFLADIISGKTEGAYQPSSGWTRGRR